MQIAQTINLYQAAQKQGLTGAQNATPGDAGFGQYLSSIMSAIMVIAALLVLFYLIWGAIEWITSGGDNGKIQKARDKMTQAVIGIIVLSATVALFMLVQQFLGIEILNFSSTGYNTGSVANPQTRLQ